uniref:Uncharacterized protein n=1 Tax=Vespula pensylvanica TaxID=30213 RepID=A0A834P3F2_VESPE|nr:hypothetical protein H0235_006736 [Vespula pensylvanica]
MSLYNDANSKIQDLMSRKMGRTSHRKDDVDDVDDVDEDDEDDDDDDEKEEEEEEEEEEKVEVEVEIVAVVIVIVEVTIIHTNYHCSPFTRGYSSVSASVTADNVVLYLTHVIPRRELEKEERGLASFRTKWSFNDYDYDYEEDNDDDYDNDNDNDNDDDPRQAEETTML